MSEEQQPVILRAEGPEDPGLDRGTASTVQEPVIPSSAATRDPVLDRGAASAGSFAALRMTGDWTTRLTTIALGLSLLAPLAPAQTMGPPPGGIIRADEKPELLKDVGIDQRLNEALPLQLAFRDEAGRAVHLSDYFGKRPVILALVYYNCPMLCTQVLNGLIGSLNTMSLAAGEDFDVVAVSFDARETPAMAAAKKDAYLSRYKHPAASQGWHFLTGETAAIAQLAQAAGFRFRYDEKREQFAHASAIFVVTPEGRLARYFYGIEYAPRDLRLSLVEASAGRIGTPVDQILLYCFHYDPASGKYGATVVNIIRLAGLATLVLLAFSLVFLSRRRSRMLRAAAGEGA